MKPVSRATAMLQNLTLMVATLVGCCIIAEAVLRTTHLFGAQPAWTTPDPTVGYRFVPNASYRWVQEADHAIVGRINRFGWRDRDWKIAKPTGTLRVAILGDSFVEAMQVEADSTFPALAERTLSERLGRPVELMNFGRSGYTQSEELLTLRNEVVQFHPDIVMLFFFPGNDITDISRVTAPNTQRPFFLETKMGLRLDASFANSTKYAVRSRIDNLKRHSALLSLLISRIAALRRGESAPNVDVLEGYLTLCTAHPDPVYLHNYELNKRLMREMNNLLAPQHTQFVVVVLPLPAYMPQLNRRFVDLDITFDHYWFVNDLSAFAAKNRMGVLSLEKPFTEAYAAQPSSLNWRDIGHWTYAGHQLVAGVLGDWFRSLPASGVVNVSLGR